MSRLYLIFFFFIFPFHFIAQNELNNYLKFAEEQYKKGDFYYSKEYYEKALTIDSNSIVTLWNYAETLKAYKDYIKAEYYYKKVYSKEEALLYPYSLLNLGSMQKMNGKYSEAIETFKNAKKKYLKDKKSYLYLKSAREVESCLWAQLASKDTSKVIISSDLEKINTTDSEFGHIIHDDQFIFSSLRADSINEQEEVYSTNYHTNLYTSKRIGKMFDDAVRLEDVFFEKLNTGNGTFSLDGKRFYFSLCKNDGYNYNCKIMVAHYKNNKWTEVDSLGEIINEVDANTTMPAIGEIDGVETLFFSSNRKGSEGGLDIWYATIKNGNQFSKPKNIKAVNSLDNDICPWWDNSNKRLYFSSSWLDGFGGHDVFYSSYTNQFETPVNMGLPVNSSANDIYFFKDGDTSYVSSNRVGVLYSKNPTCCSDVFVIKPIKNSTMITTSDTINQQFSLTELNKRLPVTLYFHNDVPNPKSIDTVTNVNYITSYSEYRLMIELYKDQYASGLKGQSAAEAKEDIENFFIEYVDQGVKNLEIFRDLLYGELLKGAKIKITIKGYASPLAKSDYNVNLTKRRINSLVNYLKEYKSGIFLPYINCTSLNGGKIIFEEVPFGEFVANKLTSDNPHDQKNSIFSRSAAIERKIEILSVSYLVEELDNKKDETIFPLSPEKQLLDGGKIKSGDVIVRKFNVTNTSNSIIEFDQTNIPCDCNSAKIEKLILKPGESTFVEMKFDSKGYSGKIVKSIYLKVKNQIGDLRLILTAEVTP